MKIPLFGAVVMLALAILAPLLGAASQSWNGDSGANLNWSNGDNWVGDPLPALVPGETAIDTATFPAGGPWTATFDGAPTPQIGSLDIQSDTALTMNGNLRVGVLTVANGVTLTLIGSGTLTAVSASMAGANLNIAAGATTLEIAASFNVVTLASFANAGHLRISGGATLTTNGTINLGNFEISDNLAIGGDVLSTGRFDVSNGASVLANRVEVNDLAIAASCSLSNSLATLVGNSLSLSGSLSSAGALTLSGGLMQTNNGASLSVAANNAFTVSNGASLIFDRSATHNFGGDLILNGVSSIQNSDIGLVGSGAPVATVGGALRVAASLTDSNMVGGLSAALHLIISGDLEVSDVAGFNLLLDESRLEFTAGPSHRIETIPTKTTFDGRIEIGFGVFAANTSFSELPPMTDVRLGSTEMRGPTTITAAQTRLMLSGTFNNLGTGSLILSGGVILPGATLRGITTASLTSFTVANGESVSLDGAIFINGSVEVQSGGALRLGTLASNADIDLLAPGHLTLRDGGIVMVGGTGFGAGTVNLEGNLLAEGGTISLGAVDSMPTLTIDGSLTLGSALGVTDAMLSVFADNVAGNGTSTLALSGALIFDTAGSRLIMGEGQHRFGGAMQLSLAPDLLVRSASLGFASDAPEIHLTGFVTQALTFEAAQGTRFFVNSFGALSNVVQSGILLLDGDIDSSASTLNDAWTVNAGAELRVGSDGAAHDHRIVLGNSAFRASDIRISQAHQPITPDVNAASTLRIVRAAGKTGIFHSGDIFVEGDRLDTDILNVGNESNAGRLSIEGAQLNSANLTLENGAALPGGFGNGAALTISGGTLRLASGDFLIGDGPSPSVFSAAGLQASDGTISVGNGRMMVAEANTSSSLLRTTLTSSPFESYQLNVAVNAHRFSIENSLVSGGSQGMADLTLGGHGGGAALAGLRMVGTDFTNMSTSGVKIGAGVEISAFANCSFKQGVIGGSLLAFLGNASGQTGSRLQADFNTFDGSTLNGLFSSIVADGGKIVSLANDSDNVSITMRASAQSPSFGSDGNGVQLTAAMAELDDNDGVDLATPDNDIIWAVRDVLRVSSLNPATRAIAADGMARAAINFQIESFGANPAVESVTLRLNLAALAGTGILTGNPDSLQLYRDNGTTLGVFDAMDAVLAMSDGATLGAGMIAFDLSAMPLQITSGQAQRWGVAFAIGAGSSGQIALSLEAGDLGSASLDTIIDGLPISGTLLATNANLTVSANFNNGAAGTTQTYLAQFNNPLVLAFDVVNAQDALATTITAVSIEINANNSPLAPSDLANVIERLVLFSSVNTGYASSYDANPANNFGAADDDAFFGVVNGGPANIAFLNSKATVVFTNLAGVALASGGTASFFMILDPSAQGSAINPAVAANLRFTFKFSDPSADGLAGGITSSGGPSDAISVGPNQAPFVGEILSRHWLIKNDVGLGGGSGGGGCALAGENSRWPLWASLCGLLALLLLRSRKAPQKRW